MEPSNLMDVVKTQLLLTQKDNMIYGLIIMAVFEFTSGFIRETLKGLKTFFDGYIKRKFEKRIVDIVETKAGNVAELYFERNYTRDDNWDMADAIISHVLEIPACEKILVIGKLEVIKNTKQFNINEDIQFELLRFRLDEKSDSIINISFRIFSESIDTTNLREFCQETLEKYLTAKKNGLGNKRYYFDQINSNMNLGGNDQKILFTKHRFVTNRTLDNVYHERQEEVCTRVRFFMENKSWYDIRGIPHTLGFLLYGAPGTGKTSTIKAIANETNRHIVNISLKSIKTKKKLKKLFIDESIEICENADNMMQSQKYMIPIDKRLFVIEDIDALDCDLVLKRSEQKTTKLDSDQGVRRVNPEEKQDLDLATLLNVIDGVLETPGRIIIISSNHPEKLDHALIRPGRIDMAIEFQRCDRTVITNMYTTFYEKEPDPEKLESVEEYVWTPAEVSQIMFRNFKDPEQTLAELANSTPEELFKFSYSSSEESNSIIMLESPQPALDPMQSQLEIPIPYRSENTKEKPPPNSWSDPSYSSENIMMTQELPPTYSSQLIPPQDFTGDILKRD